MKVRGSKKGVTNNLRSLASDIVIEQPDGDIVWGGQVLVKADVFCEERSDLALSRQKKKISRAKAESDEEKTPQSLTEGVVCPFPTVAASLAAGIGLAAKARQENINQKFREDLQRQVDAIKKQFADALPLPYRS